MESIFLIRRKLGTNEPDKCCAGSQRTAIVPSSSPCSALPTRPRRRGRRDQRTLSSNPRSRALLAIACCSDFYVVPEGLAVPYADQSPRRAACTEFHLAHGVVRRLGPVERTVGEGKIDEVSASLKRHLRRQPTAV
jgi:hypothetical protein